MQTPDIKLSSKLPTVQPGCLSYSFIYHIEPYHRNQMPPCLSPTQSWEGRHHEGLLLSADSASQDSFVLKLRTQDPFEGLALVRYDCSQNPPAVAVVLA